MYVSALFTLHSYFLYTGLYVNMEQDDETPDHDIDASMELAQIFNEESTYDNINTCDDFY